VKYTVQQLIAKCLLRDAFSKKRAYVTRFEDYALAANKGLKPQFRCSSETSEHA